MAINRNISFSAAVFLGVTTLLCAPPAQAYLVPLIGVGGVLLTMLTGVFAVLCAGIFLVFYNIRRAVLRRRAKTQDADAPHDPLEH
jgi:uncharacterized membrane protein YccC